MSFRVTVRAVQLKQNAALYADRIGFRVGVGVVQVTTMRCANRPISWEGCSVSVCVCVLVCGCNYVFVCLCACVFVCLASLLVVWGWYHVVRPDRFSELSHSPANTVGVSPK